MLTLIIAIAIWGLLGFIYALGRKLDRFDIPISIWIVIGMVLEYLVCATGITKY